MPDEPIIVEGSPYPPVVGLGRPKGTGCNQKLFAQLKAGDPSSYLLVRSRKKAQSLRVSAGQHKIPIKVRHLAEGGYAIWKLTKPE